MATSVEIKHPSHDHNLKLETKNTFYTCHGCKEVGWGSRYSCQECNYVLHKICALAPSSMSHPFYKNRTFQLLERPTSGNRYCDACGMDVLGLVYHCRGNKHDLHPLCASLQHEIEIDGVELRLRKELSSKCGKCRSKKLWREFKGWSYRSTRSNEYEFHVSCVKGMVAENWEKGCSEEEMNELAMEISTVQNLQVVQQGGSSSSNGKLKMVCKIGKMIVSFIISMLMGDPTGGISFLLLGSLMSE